jgi:hypothetical protein
MIEDLVSRQPENALFPASAELTFEDEFTKMIGYNNTKLLKRRFDRAQKSTAQTI